MEFWGVEVKPGEPLKVQPGIGKLIHISQAALGEVKDVKGAKRVPLRLKINSKSFILGALSAEERTQLMLDLVFEREFELSHDWKNGSVYVLGYVADDPVSDEEDFSDEFEDEPEDALQNGNPLFLSLTLDNFPFRKGCATFTILTYPRDDYPIVPYFFKVIGNIKQNLGNVKDAKTAAAANAGNKKVEKPVSDEDEDDNESDSDDMNHMLAFSKSAQEELNDDSEEDSEDDMDGSFSSEEEPPKMAQQTKKRPADSSQNAPVSNKKAEASTPNNTGKKTVHDSTPLPSKKAGNGPASNKSKEKNKKSDGRRSRK